MSNVEIEPVFGAVGERIDSYAVANYIEGESVIADSYIPGPQPKPKRADNLCTGNDNTCGARKANGTEFCAGHLRARGEL